MSTDNDLIFVANCAAGLENLVGEELRELGSVEIDIQTAVVHWQGSMETAYRMCLWSRYASRVLLQICSTTIKDPDDLYHKCKKIHWLDHLDSSRSFAVSATLGADPILDHSHYAALRVKDSVVDFFRENGYERPVVAKEHPAVKLHLHIHKNRATIFIDLSGESLHRRGYRSAGGIAPLKETLAAAIVTLSGWKAVGAVSKTFMDPMCGSGTLLIEAALIWGDSAPGLSRKYYGFNGWRGHDQCLWSNLVDEAVAREEAGFEREWPQIQGYDCDPQMVAVARKNIILAGLEEKIEIGCKEIGHLQPPAKNGFLLCNLPYGERLSEKEEVRFLYSGVARILQRGFSGWNVGLFLSQPDIADRLGVEVKNSYKLYNGPIGCRLLVGSVPKSGASLNHWQIEDKPVLDEGVDFANRVIKNFKKLQPWASNNDIHCFRLYDRDLPEYNVAVDIYDGWFLVQEYLPPPSIDETLAQQRFSTVLSCVRQIFQVGRDRVFIKQRKRQKGKAQYQKKERKTRYHQVREGECYFLVNFTNYLDNGLFLDHRLLRLEIARLAGGKRFLNLFGYTGSATVHAAKGGAELTTTVDLSATYLAWARNNLALNGFSSRKHETVEEDCLTWLKGARRKYDIILIDPPTFSNTKKKNRFFDVQRNHQELIRLASMRLEDGGAIFFSTNFRGFRLDEQIAHDFAIKDITKKTIPYDFQKKRPAHFCWRIRKYS